MRHRTQERDLRLIIGAFAVTVGIIVIGGVFFLDNLTTYLFIVMGISVFVMLYITREWWHDRWLFNDRIWGPKRNNYGRLDTKPHAREKPKRN